MPQLKSQRGEVWIDVAAKDERGNDVIAQMPAVFSSLENGDPASGGGGGSAETTLLAGENFIGKVGGNTAVTSVVPTTSTTPYAIGDQIGGVMAFSGMARIAGGTGMVQMISIHCKSLQTFACELWLFHTNPTATTSTDNTAFDLNAADFDKVLGVVPVSTWFAAGPTRSFSQATQLSMPYKITSGSTFWGILVSRSTPTLVSTSDLSIAVKSLLD